MAICNECSAFTKYDNGLCYSCFSKKNSSVSSEKETARKGLSDDERKFRYGMIKGRIAETLVQELFLSLGYNVFRYGMENTIPGIMQLLRGIRSDVAQDIRRMPDFVMQNPRTNDVFFVEVKFRANGEFKRSDLPTNYPFTNAYIIHLSKKHIKCITVKELLEGKEITATSQNYLGNRKEFGLDKDVIIDFCEFAVKFFDNV